MTIKSWRITWMGDTADLTTAKLTALNTAVQSLGFTVVSASRFTWADGVAAYALYREGAFSLLWLGNRAYITAMIRQSVDRAALYQTVRDTLGLTNETEMADEALL